MRKNRTRLVSTLILILVFLVGLSLLLYPTVSDYWNSIHQTRVIADYMEEVANLDDETYEAMLNSAREYNSTLLSKKTGRFSLTDEELEEYNSQLYLSATTVMGYIEITKIGVYLPIYHGTSSAALQVGVGHLEGSSLPVGGESTHCVLSGHRGLPSAKLFTDLDQMEVGDTFTITVLDEVLTYEVDQIRIVEPDDTSDLEIVEGEDYCTLITCTPYGINTHRMLVRGRRIETAVTSDVRVTADAMQVEPVTVAPFIAAILIVLLLIGLIVGTRRNRNKKKKNDAQTENTENSP